MHRLRTSLPRNPLLIAAVGCGVLAILSALVLPTVPSYDPWSWIVWGREVSDPHLSFAVGGGPSWKPLPFLFTTLWGFFGGGAPTLWVITARAGGLLGLVAAYRLGALLATRAAQSDGDRVRWLAPIAGVIAALGLVLTQEWTYYMFRGTSEPMLLGAALWAIDRHLAGRHTTAFWLGIAAALIRPEAWPFIGSYAIWLWWHDRRPQQLAVLLLGLAAIPVLWFGPPWIGSGQPLLAASHAKAYNGHLGSDPFIEVLRRGADLQLTTLLVLAVTAVALTWWRERDRAVLGLAAIALAWWVLVTAMTLVGYPGLERFFLPAAGVACVLGAAGIVRLADLAASRSGTLGGVGVVVVLVAIALVLAPGRLSEARGEPHEASRAVTRLDQLSDAVKAAGGHDGVFPCKTSFAAVNHGAQTALAWKLRVTLGRVGTAMRHSGVLFVGPHDAIDGGGAAINQRLTHRQLIAHVGAWEVYRVWRGAHPGRCVGGAGTTASS